MKKLLLSLLIMIIAVPAFAKDPKETVEYWKNLKKNNSIQKISPEIDNEMKKCWNNSQTHFIVPIGSKQWNICCAILAVFDPWGESSFEEVYQGMIEAKEIYGDKYQ